MEYIILGVLILGLIFVTVCLYENHSKINELISTIETDVKTKFESTEEAILTKLQAIETKVVSDFEEEKSKITNEYEKTIDDLLVDVKTNLQKIGIKLD